MIMDFKDLCHARYSVRAFKPDAIPAEKMEYIKECTRLAPSAVNRQPWKFILFTGEDDRARLQQCYDKEWFREAPAYILVCENHGAAWTRRYDEKNHADIDVAIAIEHLCLAAAEQGLGTCWVCNDSGHKDLQTPPTGGLKNNMLKTKNQSQPNDFSFG